MTDLPDPDLEAEARALFEADPSSQWEADWDNLAAYKRDGWLACAALKRVRAEADREMRRVMETVGKFKKFT